MTRPDSGGPTVHSRTPAAIRVPEAPSSASCEEMGFRLYKSVRLSKGVRLNLSKTGIGISGGVPGAMYSVHSSGRTTKSVGVPGTGVSYRKDSYAKGSRSSGTRSKQPPAPVAPMYPRAGLLAPKAEKVFVEGVTAYMQGCYEHALQSFMDVNARDVGGNHAAEEFFAGMTLVALEQLDRAVPSSRRCSRPITRSPMPS